MGAVTMKIDRQTTVHWRHIGGGDPIELTEYVIGPIHFDQELHGDAGPLEDFYEVLPVIQMNVCHAALNLPGFPNYGHYPEEPWDAGAIRITSHPNCSDERIITVAPSFRLVSAIWADGRDHFSMSEPPGWLPDSGPLRLQFRPTVERKIWDPFDDGIQPESQDSIWLWMVEPEEQPEVD